MKSSAFLHLFLEGVLTFEEDKSVIDKLCENYIRNPDEFFTPFPFPAVSVSDKSWLSHKKPNSWGYYSQALIALRCTMWMDKYGLSEELDHLCRKWLEGVTKNHDRVPFGQELDPVTGKASDCSRYYSSCMLFYIYSAGRVYDIRLEE